MRGERTVMPAKNKLRLLTRGWFADAVSGNEIDPCLWIFSAKENTSFNDNARHLFRYVLKHCPEIKPRFVINDEKKRQELSGIYGEEFFIETLTVKGMKEALRGGVWFTSAGLPVYGPFVGKGRYIVNLWHGLPLKKIALQDPNLGRASRLYFKTIFSGNYSYVLTSASELIPVMARSLGVAEEQVRVWGQPRCDVLIPDREGLPENRLQKIILYAPTFRDHVPTRIFPFDDFDLTEWNHFLEKEKILLLLSLHPQEMSLAEPYLGERMLTAEQALEKGILTSAVEPFRLHSWDAAEYLPCMDLLITDYSSIYLDYLLLNRPMIFLPYDQKEYEEKRGMNFPYEDVTPGPKPRTMAELMECIRMALSGEDGFEEQRVRVRNRFHEVKGSSSEIIVREMLERIRGKDRN